MYVYIYISFALYHVCMSVRLYVCMSVCMYCIALYCICIVLYCIVLYCNCNCIVLYVCIRLRVVYIYGLYIQGVRLMQYELDMPHAFWLPNWVN